MFCAFVVSTLVWLELSFSNGFFRGFPKGTFRGVAWAKDQLLQMAPQYDITVISMRSDWKIVWRKSSEVIWLTRVFWKLRQLPHHLWLLLCLKVQFNWGLRIKIDCQIQTIWLIWILICHLNPSERTDIIQLICQHLALFSEVQTCTNVLEHDIDVGQATPTTPI